MTDLSALAACVREIDAHTRDLGWDRPPCVFALVPAADLLARADLAEEALAAVRAQHAADPATLTAVLQLTPGMSDIEQIAGSVYFPEEIAGAALAVERLALPPEAEADLPADPQAQAAWVAEHPLRQEIRVIAARLRSGEAWCAVRGRGYDDPGALLEGADLAPELLEALALMCQPEH